MDSLNGATLIKADGSKFEAEKALENKVGPSQSLEVWSRNPVSTLFIIQDFVLYYFSAHWCPPCRQFTPMLSDFYGEVSDDIEIVFVSSDRSPEDMVSYMNESHGDWYGVEHNSPLANDLEQKYGVQGIPMLVVVKKDGTLVTKDGRSHVMAMMAVMAVKQAVQGWKDSSFSQSDYLATGVGEGDQGPWSPGPGKGRGLRGNIGQILSRSRQVSSAVRQVVPVTQVRSAVREVRETRENKCFCL